MSKFYPIMLRLDGKDVLVIGGGKVAERKVKSLLECGANIFIVSKQLTDLLQTFVDENRITFLGKDFLPEYLDGKFLAIVATDDTGFNTYVAKLAKQKKIMVNVVDCPSECDFIVPSVIRRGDLIIAISTSERSPFFSKSIREQLELLYGHEYGVFLEISAILRDIMIRKGVSEESKNRALKRLWDSGLVNKIKENDVEAMAQIIAGLSKYF